MKRLILSLLALCILTGAAAKTYGIRDVPNVQLADRTRYVSNPDGILSYAAVARIDSICASLRDRNIAQVAVVAVDDIAGGDVFDFAIELFGSWGVGRGDRDNGVGILLVRDRREIRMVTGDGVEGVLPDAIVKRIQTQYMLPYFREGDYSAGMVAGVEAVAKRLEGSELDLGGTDTATGELPARTILLIVLGFIAVPLGLGMLAYYRQKRCPRCHRFKLVLQSQEAVQSTPTLKVIEYTYVCSNCGKVVKRQVRSARDNHLGGPGGGVFMGGGFGGFGGGRGSSGGGFGGGHFGGGGAGSRW